MRMPPLSPDQGGMSITAGALDIADLIVTTGNAMISKVIRRATWSSVSHAMLYAGDGHVIEAIGDGVVRRSLHDALQEATLAVAYRHATITAEGATAVVNQAARWIGRGYDGVGAAAAGVANNMVLCEAFGIVPCTAAKSGLVHDRDSFFCSELVMQAFADAGFPIGRRNPSTAVPEEIPRAYSLGRLLYVGHLRT